jgi:CRISPR-associated endonuclease/helicase Cas3
MEGKNSKEAIAHRRKTDGETQSVTQHLLAVGTKTGEFAGAIGLAELGELLGLLHDIGKYSGNFQNYIQSATGMLDEDADDYVNAAGLRGQIDHSTAGAQLIHEKLSARGKQATYVGEVLALCLASHHSGLIDALEPDGTNNLEHRLEKSDEKVHLVEVHREAPSELTKRIDKLIDDDRTLEAFYSLLKRVSCNEKEQVLRYFQFGMIHKYLFSCLIDADRSDTADFEEPVRVQIKDHSDYVSWAELELRLEARLSEYPTENRIDHIRKDISEACLKAGKRPRGVYSLTVPTGGGKTLASLRFALRHAQEHNRKSVFYIIPFTSIIDQNAAQVRTIMESPHYGRELRGLVVLEHHSNLTPDEETSQQKILSENWDSPIVFTTNVQFLESFFGHGTRGIRRMHQLANSIIIFDEVQTIPIRCVHLFNNVINFLVSECNSTVIMCTATQPLLDDVDPSRGALRPSKNSELMHDLRGLFAELKRVELIDRRKDGGWNLDELASLAQAELRDNDSLLVVVNTKRSAKEFYLALKKSVAIKVFHLSTNMCPAHRLRILRRVRWLLKRGRPVVCVSTQLIEAGVDIDFGAVIRFMAGLDSIAQAAGRCNRNGLRAIGRVTIVNPVEENLDKLPDIKVGRDCAERVMREFQADKDAFDRDLLGPKAMRRYFELYFYARKDEMDYSVGSDSPVGRSDNLLSLLSTNRQSVLAYEQAHNGNLPNTKIWQSFMTASKAFEAIDSPTQGVIVPYREGRDIINELLASEDPELRFELLKRAQRYSVNLFRQTKNKLLEGKALHEVPGIGVFYLDSQYYDYDSGLNESGSGRLDTLIG